MEPQPYRKSSADATNSISRTTRKQAYLPVVSYDGGGRLTTTEERFQEAVKRHDKWEVFLKEQEMCRVLAMAGYDVVHRQGEGTGNTYDATINGIKADLKRTASHNNIVKYAKDAIRRQGAEIVVFQFDSEESAIYKQLNILKREYGIHGMYFFTGKEHQKYSF